MNAPLRYTMFFAWTLIAIVPAVATATDDPVNGKVLYTANCQKCHGAPPDKFAMHAHADIDLLQRAINNEPQMSKEPGLKLLTLDQLTDIVAYLASLSTTAAPANYQGLWWFSPGGAEDGWGINFAHQGDTIFGTWFTYDTTGKGWWLTLIATKSATDVYTGNVYATTGPPFNTVPFVQALGQRAVDRLGHPHLYRCEQRILQLLRQSAQAARW